MSELPHTTRAQVDAMWRRIYAAIDEAADAAIVRIFGQAWRGGKLDGGSVSGTLPSSVLPSSVLQNPMTSVGDLIVGGTSGATTRLGVGSTGQVLTVAAGTAAWEAPSSATSAFQKISETILSASAASVTFGSIPQTYRHLVLKINARCDAAATNEQLLLQFNGDSTASYDTQYMGANGTTVYGGESIGATSIVVGNVEGTTNTQVTDAAYTEVTVVDYARTTWRKTCKTFGSLNLSDINGGNHYTLAGSGWYRNAAAVTSVTLFAGGSANLVTGSVFSLYGMS